MSRYFYCVSEVTLMGKAKQEGDCTLDTLVRYSNNMGLFLLDNSVLYVPILFSGPPISCHFDQGIVNNGSDNSRTFRFP